MILKIIFAKLEWWLCVCADSVWAIALRRPSTIYGYGNHFVEPTQYVHVLISQSSALPFACAIPTFLFSVRSIYNQYLHNLTADFITLCRISLNYIFY